MATRCFQSYFLSCPYFFSVVWPCTTLIHEAWDWTGKKHCTFVSFSKARKLQLPVSRKLWQIHWASVAQNRLLICWLVFSKIKTQPKAQKQQSEVLADDKTVRQPDSWHCALFPGEIIPFHGSTNAGHSTDWRSGISCAGKYIQFLYDQPRRNYLFHCLFFKRFSFPFHRSARTHKTSLVVDADRKVKKWSGYLIKVPCFFCFVMTCLLLFFFCSFEVHRRFIHHKRKLEIGEQQVLQCCGSHLQVQEAWTGRVQLGTRVHRCKRANKSVPGNHGIYLIVLVSHLQLWTSSFEQSDNTKKCNCIFSTKSSGPYRFYPECYFFFMGGHQFPEVHCRVERKDFTHNVAHSNTAKAIDPSSNARSPSWHKPRSYRGMAWVFGMIPFAE